MNKDVSLYLRKIRNAFIVNDLRLFTWKIFCSIVLFFLIIIAIESKFYLTTVERIFTIRFFIVGILLTLFSLTIIYLLILKNRFRPYQWKTISEKIGRDQFEDHDHLFNVFQIENQKGNNQSETLVKSLSDETLSKLKKIKYKSFFPTSKINKWKKISFYLLLVTNFFILYNFKTSSEAVTRWFNPSIEFKPPIPFKINSSMRHVNVLAGEDVNLIFSFDGKAPDSLLLELKSFNPKSNKDSIQTLSSPIIDDKVSFNIKNVLQNFRYKGFYRSKSFWDPWDEITTDNFSISIIDRPSIEDFTVSVIPPKYTKLDTFYQKANQSEIKALYGSKVNIYVKSNLPLAKAEIEFSNEIYKMIINDYKGSFDFELEKDDNFTINLTDERGVRNRNPIPFKLIKIDDIKPNIYVNAPLPVSEIKSDQIIPLDITIKDDYGFSSLQLAYEIKRPEYFKSEPIISMFNIPININNENKQNIKTTWDLNPLGLMPEDEINFHFELYDNDVLNGPKKVISNTLKLRLPSLNDLFRSFTSKEDEITDFVRSEIKDFDNIQKQLKKAELDMLKSNDPSWSDSENLKKVLDETLDKISEFKTLNQELEKLSSLGSEQKLFSDNMIKKFSELNNLIKKIIPEDLANELNKLKNDYDQMKTEDLLESIKKLADNINSVESELNRFLEIFKKIRTEQIVEEIRTRTKQAVKNQNNIDKRLRTVNSSSDKEQLKKLVSEQEINNKEVDNILKDIKNSVEPIKEFSRITAQSLENISRSDNAKKTQKNLKNITAKLKKDLPYEAMDASSLAIESLSSMGDDIDKALDKFQKQSIQKMASKFQILLNDIIVISKSQESLLEYSKIIPRNSSRLSELANEQQLLQDQLKLTMKKGFDLSKETFFITPEMGKEFGIAFGQMNSSKSKLFERNTLSAVQNQEKAMNALNETARKIIENIKKMRESETTSGYEEFLERMKSISEKQSSINGQSMDLSLGQFLAQKRDGVIGSVLNQQNGIKKSLQQLMKEFENNPNISKESLNGILKEIDEVIKNIEQGNSKQTIISRQKKILSRMIDSQKSLTIRGEKEKERTSITAQQKEYDEIMKSNTNNDQTNLIIIDAMNEALSSGFSIEYQKMIRRYFNSMLTTKLIIDEKDDKSND